MSGRLKTGLRRAYRRLAPRWLKHRFLYPLFAQQRIAPPELIEHFDESRILVVAPHMDDEIIGCGGTLRKQVLAGSQVAVVFLTDGCKGDAELRARTDVSPADRKEFETRHSTLRKEEARRTAAILGIQELFFLDFPDGSFRSGPETVTPFLALVENWKPGLIFLPFVTDRHRDHEEANALVVEAIRTSQQPWPDLKCAGYETWSPLFANRMVEIGEVLEDKKRALQQLKSQLAHTDYIAATLGLNAYRSMIHLKGHSHAEAFYYANFQDYADLYDQLTYR